MTQLLHHLVALAVFTDGGGGSSNHISISVKLDVSHIGNRFLGVNNALIILSHSLLSHRTFSLMVFSSVDLSLRITGLSGLRNSLHYILLATIMKLLGLKSYLGLLGWSLNTASRRSLNLSVFCTEDSSLGLSNLSIGL